MDECRCNCGYTCGGPGRCEINAENYPDLKPMERTMKCINEHFVRDCDHEWNGPVVEFGSPGGGSGGSVSCVSCGVLMIDHNCDVGP